MSKPTVVKKPKVKTIYLHIPAKLTEEEFTLQSKYQKLKKKKKNLLKQRAPPRPEPEPLPIKRPRSPKIEARDAREIAKKLLKSGAIHINKAPTPGKEGFKRSLGLERKLTTPDQNVGYQPFSATIMEGCGDATGKIFRKNRYVPYNELGDKVPPKRGQTLFISGYTITEHLVQDALGPYGKIIKLIMDHDKHHAFVTLDSEEGSQKAISELNDATVNGIRVKVSLARRQLVFNNSRWAALPEADIHKEGDDKRDILSYEDNIFKI